MKYKIIIIAYYHPRILYPVSPNLPYYVEGKILFSNKEKAQGYANGYRVEYDVKGYGPYHIPVKENEVQKFHRMVKDNPDKYPGAHHLNFYGPVTPNSFAFQILVNG